MRHGLTGLFKGNFLPLYVQAREIAYTTKCIMHAWQATGIIPLNSRVVLNKLTTTLKNSPPPNHVISTPLPATPNYSQAMTRLIQQRKLLLQTTLPSEQQAEIVNQLIDLLQRFGIARERDYQLVEQTFIQWRETNKLNIKRAMQRCWTCSR